MGMNFMYLLGFVLNFLQNENVCKKINELRSRFLKNIHLREKFVNLGLKSFYIAQSTKDKPFLIGFGFWQIKQS